MQETRVQSLGWKDTLEKEMATHLQYSFLENAMDRGAWQATAHGVTRVGSNLATEPPPPEGFCWVDKASHVKDNGYLQTGGYLGLEVST